VAFYVAGAIPVIASIAMFAVPFLIPPKEHPFWRHYPPSSKQYLIQDSSDASGASEVCQNNKNTPKVTPILESVDGSGAGKIAHDKVDRTRFLITTKENQSFTSIPSLHLVAPAIDKHVSSMRDIGSISSFGSVIFSPASPVMRARSSKNMVVVDQPVDV